MIDWMIFAGLAAFMGGFSVSAKKAIDDSKTKGIKEGYAKASREYEAKFQTLKGQLTEAHHTIQEQAEHIRELRNFIKSLLSVIERYRSDGQDVTSLVDTYTQAQELERRLAA